MTAPKSRTPPASTFEWVIDSDTHISEPPDLLTSRLPRKWHDQAPKIVRNEQTGYENFTAVTGSRSTPPPTCWTNFPSTTSSSRPTTPHPVCLDGHVREKIDAGLAGVKPELRRKLLFDNAAKLYKVEAPPARRV